MIPLCRAGFCVSVILFAQEKQNIFDLNPAMRRKWSRTLWRWCINTGWNYITFARPGCYSDTQSKNFFFSLLHGLFWLSSPFKLSLCACQQHHPLAIMWITLWAKKKKKKNRMLLFVFLPGEGSHEPWMCRAELRRRRTSIFDWAWATFHLKWVKNVYSEVLRRIKCCSALLPGPCAQ